MDWKFDDSRPIWPQIKDKLMRKIASGHYAMGSPFPTVRDLAEEARVNRNTMQRALSELEKEGLVVTNRTAGRTVTTDEALIENTRMVLAGANVRSFLDEMKALGFTEEQTVKVIEEEIRR